MLEVSSDIAKTAQSSIIKSVGVSLTKWMVLTVLMLCVSIPASAAVPKKTNAFKEGERLIYTRLVESYRKNNLAELTRQRKLLERNFPKSVHLDNAYYFAGMLEFQNDRLSEALRNFGHVSDRYPASNKRPAALFGKAMAYKRLGLSPQFSKVLNQIIKQYTGSPESQRAWMHLAMEKQTSLKQ